ncbi:MAG TPA: HAD-IA family hydrolase [Nitrosopumilaceae archaeon]|nr:HAD-IA family hydrolase [Nitrosopumilaceae archaeon]
MTLKKVGEGIYTQNDFSNEIHTIDGIIFDCDGVLVDVSNSYDLTIQKTTSYILNKIANISKLEPITSKIIDGFKATGGFNDEVDLTYALILTIAAADNLKKNTNQFIFEVIKNSNQTGIKSVEKFLDDSKADINLLKNKLNYPGTNHDNFLYSIFDQIFYGPQLYFKLFKKTSNFTEKGLIENDLVLLKNDLIETLHQKFGRKMAIVSGRGLESIRYSLKDLLDEFDIKNSYFLEDESRELAKPNPASLIQTISGIGTTHCLYVGDSMEDFIMAQKATELGNKITFCGIIGTSKNPDDKMKLFEERNVPLVLYSIDLLPKVLNLV